MITMKHLFFPASLLLSLAIASPLDLAAQFQKREPGGWQDIPDTSKAPNTFNIGTAMEGGQPKQPAAGQPVPAMFQARDIDLPFGRLIAGKIMYFRPGEMNSPTGASDIGAGTNDDAKQSACGIPDNAHSNSKVAIHPYWLKYANLARKSPFTQRSSNSTDIFNIGYCMQDVCIAFWTAGGVDMVSKVIDICNTDPEDPSHCATPNDIKLPRTKVQVLRGKTSPVWYKQPQFSGNGDTEPIYWYFTKCLGEVPPPPSPPAPRLLLHDTNTHFQSNVQPPYKDPAAANWFATPLYPIPNNGDAVQLTIAQARNNTKSYPSRQWPVYPVGVTPGKVAAGDKRISPIADWVAGQEPAWEPIAGGEGFGKSRGKDVNQLNSIYPDKSAGNPRPENKGQQSQPKGGIVPVIGP